MDRATIEVTKATRDQLKAARVDLYADAGGVLTTDRQVLFLLGVWQYVRDTPAGLEACQVIGDNLRSATRARGE